MTPEQLLSLTQYRAALREYQRGGMVDYVDTTKGERVADCQEVFPMNAVTMMKIHDEISMLNGAIAIGSASMDFEDKVWVSYSEAALMLNTTPANVASLHQAGKVSGNRSKRMLRRGTVDAYRATRKAA